MTRIVTFGEVMLRLKSPGFERLFQSPQLEATFGGAEANVAVSLAQFGLPVSFVTALPSNPLGESAVSEIRKFGVDTSLIKRAGDRLGIYFLEPGSNQRASKVPARTQICLAVLASNGVWLNVLFAERTDSRVSRLVRSDGGPTVLALDRVGLDVFLAVRTRTTCGVIHSIPPDGGESYFSTCQTQVPIRMTGRVEARAAGVATAVPACTPSSSRKGSGSAR